MINYYKLDYDRFRHFERWKKRINSMPKKLVCQECAGAGGEVEVVLDDGTGPFYSCGWCEGIGYVDNYRRGEWLRYRKSITS